ncbi:MAG: META domain-containing protein [Draconibacterium sp.]|nr:META domain-containing protein [Draconibacterium sp.]
MKYFLLPINAFLLFIMLVSCNKDSVEVADDIYNSWEVVEFMSVESVHYSKIDNYNPIIEFRNDGDFSLKLDANNCVGSFNLFGESGIEITTPGCTKICCDSEFSNKLTIILSQVESYSIIENQLKLNISGWGWIDLKLQ